MKQLSKTTEAVPTWALNYMINGAATGLTDAEIAMVDNIMQANKIQIVSPCYNEEGNAEPYFTYYPWFGLPAECEDCDILYYE